MQHNVGLNQVINFVGYKRVGDVETSHVFALSFSSVNFAKSFISQKIGETKKETLIGTRIWEVLRRLCVFFSSVYGVNYKL